MMVPQSETNRMSFVEYEYDWNCPLCKGANRWQWRDFESNVRCSHCGRAIYLAELPPARYGCWLILIAGVCTVLLGLKNLERGIVVYGILMIGGWYWANREMLEASEDDRKNWIRKAQVRLKEEETAERERIITEQAAAARANRIQQEATQSLEKLRAISPRNFEKLVCDSFASRGWATHLCDSGADGGVDIELRKNGRFAVVQCKRYKGVVGVRILRELLGALTRTGADEAFIVTTGRCSSECRRFATDSPITIIDEERILRFLRDQHNRF